MPLLTLPRQQEVEAIGSSAFGHGRTRAIHATARADRPRARKELTGARRRSRHSLRRSRPNRPPTSSRTSKAGTTARSHHSRGHAGLSTRRDPHGVSRVLGECSKIASIARQHDCPAQTVSLGHDDRIHRRGGSRASHGGTQHCRVPSQALVDWFDDAEPQKPVLVEVPAVIAGERLGEHHGRHDRGPLLSASQLPQPSPVPGKRRHSAGIENEGHAECRRDAGPRTRSAQALASACSASLIGPSSASISARYASSSAILESRPSSAPTACWASWEMFKPARRAWP